VKYLLVDFDKKNMNFEDYYLGRNDVEVRMEIKVDYLVYYRDKYGVTEVFYSFIAFKNSTYSCFLVFV